MHNLLGLNLAEKVHILRDDSSASPYRQTGRGDMLILNTG